jgi:hypothetical protein
LKVFPTTPVPDHDPPGGLPTKFTLIFWLQTVLSEPAETTGRGKTVTATELLAVQPNALVPVTV